MASTFYEPGDQRSLKVNALFRKIARRYDLINDLQSGGLHRIWKKRVVQLAQARRDERALDLCCGTGDLAWALAGKGAATVGLDFTREMLMIAEDRGQGAEIRSQKSEVRGQRSGRGGQSSEVSFVQGDAQKIPFQDNCFDVLTVGYGLRNLVDWRRGILEMQRVARPGGRLIILEFSRPRNSIWRAVYLGYLKLFVPLLGLTFCGNANTHSYILESLKHYPSQEEVAKVMREFGLKNVTVHSLLWGAMSIHYAEK